MEFHEPLKEWTLKRCLASRSSDPLYTGLSTVRKYPTSIYIFLRTTVIISYTCKANPKMLNNPCGADIGSGNTYYYRCNWEPGYFPNCSVSMDSNCGHESPANALFVALFNIANGLVISVYNPFKISGAARDAAWYTKQARLLSSRSVVVLNKPPVRSSKLRGVKVLTLPVLPPMVRTLGYCDAP